MIIFVEIILIDVDKMIQDFVSSANFSNGVVGVRVGCMNTEQSYGVLE